MFSLNFYIILFLTVAISSGSLLDKTDLECALKHTLCNPGLTRPCCDPKNECKKTWPDNYHRCVGDVMLWGLNKFCELNEDCDEITHAKCSRDNKCVCREKNVKVDPWTCAPTLGAFCWKNESCATTNAACINNECKCRAKYFRRSNNQCELKILGASCQSDEMCSSQVKFSKCSENKTCTCTGNTTEISPVLCAPTIGGFCWLTDECVVLHSLCIKNKCQCMKGNKYVVDIGCVLDIQPIVIPNRTIAICSDFNHCICFGDPFKFTQCSIMDINHCRTNESCLVENSLCIEGVCKCDPRFLYRSERCIPQFLNGACRYDSDCQLIDNAVCLNHKCVCDINYTQYNEKLCKPLLDGICSSTENCSAINSICIENKCKCKESTVEYTKKLCVAPQLGVACQDDDNCAEILESECSFDQKCECLPGLMEYNITACAPMLGGSCAEHHLCAVLHSSCLNSTCSCDYGFVGYSNNKCVPHHLGMKCREDHDCKLMFGSECINGTCSCQDNYSPLNTSECGPILGRSCKTGQKCAVANSICLEDECRCQLNYTPENDLYCRRNPGQLRIKCNDIDQCAYIKYSYCSFDHECVCKYNYVSLGIEKCVGLIGEACDLSDECISYNTVCVNKKCQCSQSFYASSLHHCEKVSLGIPCKKNEHCLVAMENSECSADGICVCPKNHYAINEFECAPMILEACISNDDCRSNSSLCIDGKCQCKPGFRAVSESQCRPYDYMFECDSVLDCGDPWHYQCNYDKRCRCRSNHYSINRSTCVPLLKGYCWKDSQCLANNSECRDFYCQCKEHFVAVSNNLCRPKMITARFF